ncbi:MAG: aspartate aminotransferase family protein [Actinomycetes bacterium]
MTLPAPDPARGQEVYDLDRAHVFHSWSAQGLIKPLPIAAAEGSYFWDYDGKRYLDFSSQLVNTNIGHQHPKVVAAIQEQAGRMATIAPQHANDARSEAARLVSSLAPTRHSKVFFTNGGADANENAVRMARLHTGRHKVLSAYRSYHGNTSTAVALTGDPRRWPNETGISGIVHFFGPYTYRSPFWAEDDEQEAERALQHLEAVIQFEGPQTIAALVLETVVGTAGVLIPPANYLAGVRELCTRYGIVYIADEVMCGFGRTGDWFAFDHFGVEPDLITFAKGVNSGYVPVGGVIISDEIAETFDQRVFPGGLTYSGHPLAAASIVATLTAMQEEGIVDNAKRIGEDVLGPGLRDLADRHPVIGEVRGMGVFWALDLVKNQASREMLVPYNAAGEANKPMAELVTACRERGLMPFVNYNRLHVVPPCTVSEAEAKEGLALLDEAFAVLAPYYQG